MTFSQIADRYGAHETTSFGEADRTFLLGNAAVVVKQVCDYCRTLQPEDPETNCRNCGAPVILGAERLQ